jgi:autotransporter-associated beta strand protein
MKTSPLTAIALAAIAAVFSVSFAFAGSATWTGASNNEWKNNANWNPSNTFPNGGSDVATFNIDFRTSIEFGTGLSAINQIIFDTASVGSFTFSGDPGALIGLGGAAGTPVFQMTSTVSNRTQTFNLGVNIAGATALNISNAGTNNSFAFNGGIVHNSAAGNTTRTLSFLGGGTGTSTMAGLNDVTVGAGVATSRLVVNSGGTKVVVTGDSSYRGKTTVTAGTLILNGVKSDPSAIASGEGYGSATDGHILVQTGATLGGSGRLVGNNSQNNSNLLLVQSGGKLNPGEGIGTLRIDSANLTGTGSRALNMASGAVFDFDLAWNGTSSDRIDLWNYSSGKLLLNNNTINFSLLGGPSAGTYTVDLFRFYSDSGTTLAASGIASGLTVGTLDANITSANIIYGTDTIQLEYMVVPEPSTWALLAVSLTALVVFRRRRQS